MPLNSRERYADKIVPLISYASRFPRAICFHRLASANPRPWRTMVHAGKNLSDTTRPVLTGRAPTPTPIMRPVRPNAFFSARVSAGVNEAGPTTRLSSPPSAAPLQSKPSPSTWPSSWSRRRRARRVHLGVSVDITKAAASSAKLSSPMSTRTCPMLWATASSTSIRITTWLSVKSR